MSCLLILSSCPHFPIEVVLQEDACLKWAELISSGIWALLSIVITIILFKISSKVNKSDKDSERKQSLMKILVLDYAMPRFYDIVETLAENLKPLKNSECNKKEVETNIQKTITKLREQFIVLFLAIDEKLYNDILIEADKCIDSIVESISDDGINLYVESKYKDHIQSKIKLMQQNIIKLLYNYNKT